MSCTQEPTSNIIIEDIRGKVELSRNGFPIEFVAPFSLQSGDVLTVFEKSKAKIKIERNNIILKERTVLTINGGEVEISALAVVRG